ncbi:LuxR C-terminal-related transcriptional regulator [Sphingomonas natans]|nr:response regulator transcription factor [Sphingomonas sp. BIUV-7]
MREGISKVLASRDFSVPLAASSICEFCAQPARDVDIVLMALEPSSVVGDVCTELSAACPQARQVLTASNFEIDDIVIAYQRGIAGLILSSGTRDQFAASLRLVALGERVLSGDVVDFLVERGASEDPQPVGPGAQLSEREIDTLNLLVQGDANKVIARRLNISEATVKVHVKAILRKLRLTNRTQAALWGAQRHAGKTPIR